MGGQPEATSSAAAPMASASEVTKHRFYEDNFVDLMGAAAASLAA